jgi:hypothetical protein
MQPASGLQIAAGSSIESPMGRAIAPSTNLMQRMAFGYWLSGPISLHANGGAVRLHGLARIAVPPAEIALAGSLVWIVVVVARGAAAGSIERFNAEPITNSSALYLPLCVLSLFGSQYRFGADEEEGFRHAGGDFNFDTAW